jgi:hypothetical protein
MSRTITIRILEEKTNAEPSPAANTQNENEPKPSGKESDKKKGSGAYMLSAFISQNVVGTIRNQAEYYASKYLSMTEDYGWQTNIENAKTAINIAGSLANSGVMGYAMGATVSAGWGVAMAIVNVATTAVKTTMSGIRGVENEIESIHQQAYSNYFNSTRVGYVDGNRGTEN